MNCWVLFCCLKNGNEQQKVLDQKKIMCVNGEKMSYGIKKDTIHKRPQIYHQAILDTILRKNFDHIPDFFFFCSLVDINKRTKCLMSGITTTILTHSFVLIFLCKHLRVLQTQLSLHCESL